MSDWRIQPVFISSTFKDMHSERDWLVKRVFPALRERLEKYRVHLVDIDLRWGITEEQERNGEVLKLCLRRSSNASHSLSGCWVSVTAGCRRRYRISN